MAETGTVPRATALRAEALGARLPPLVVAAERVAATVMQGVHGRRRAGQGDAFWQFRPYTPGDALNRLDWRQSAKSDRLFVRETEWEAAQSVALWRDAGETMRWSSGNLPQKGKGPSCCCWPWPPCCCAAGNGCGCWVCAVPLPGVACCLPWRKPWSGTRRRRLTRACPAMPAPCCSATSFSRWRRPARRSAHSPPAVSPGIWCRCWTRRRKPCPIPAASASRH
ncbi:DUF58 domain-containing protein [Pseudoroseomonas wenyumeiae]